MVSFNPIAEVGETIGIRTLRPGLPEWLPAIVQTVSFQSIETPGQFAEFYSVQVTTPAGNTYVTTVGRDRLSICKHLFTNQ